jgi:sugar-specific transcriptional regulator TrmB
MDSDLEEKRSIADSFFKALKIGGLTAKEISKRSGVRQASISSFRNGGDIYSSVLQKLINALPDAVYQQYLLLLSEKESLEKDGSQERTDDPIVERIENLAYQLRKNRLN